MFIPLILLGSLAFFGLKHRRRWANFGIITLVCALLDWALLAALPRLGLSYGSLQPSLFLIHLVRIFGLTLVFLLFGAKSRSVRVKNLLPIVGIILQIGILLVEGYGLYIEPFNLGTTPLQESAPQFIEGRPLRILQISDLHVERITRREEEMLATINALAPDIIVLTGDYVNIDYRSDPETHADTHEVLAQLSAPYGIYAVTGTTGVDIPEAMDAVFEGLDIQLLDDDIAIIPLPKNDLYILGITMTRDITADRASLAKLAASIPEEKYTLLLYHSPDMIETAAASGINLYLAGHTHGGQIRLPIYGAIVTSSHYGKKYEMGYYTHEETTLYVSRGVGMEGLNMPRARFLAPPELVLIELSENPAFKKSLQIPYQEFKQSP